MKYLYINPLLPDITLSLIENGAKIEEKIIPRWDDFHDFPPTILDIIDTHEIDTVWVILWPGAFTRMRIVTLTLSILILTRWTPIKGCHFFDTIEAENPIIQANSTEYIIKNLDTKTQLTPLKEVPQGTYVWYGVQNDFTDGKILIQYKEDWRYIESVFSLIPLSSILVPIYLKEPHITWSKKSTSPSSEKTNT